MKALELIVSLAYAATRLLILLLAVFSMIRIDSPSNRLQRDIKNGAAYYPRSELSRRFSVIRSI